MKFTCSLVLFALFASETTNAIKVRDDLFKDLANDLAADMAKDEGGAETSAAETPTPAPAVTPKDDAKKEVKTEAKKTETKKTDAKKDVKADAKKTDTKKTEKKTAAKEDKAEKKEKVEDEIPMDNAAIKAYSSVIADAAEDSEPQKPVIYSQTIQDEEQAPRRETVGIDPMGSMIQNEISSIKEASIKAAQDTEWKQYGRNWKQLIAEYVLTILYLRNYK